MLQKKCFPKGLVISHCIILFILLKLYYYFIEWKSRPTVTCIYSSCIWKHLSLFSPFLQISTKFGLIYLLFLENIRTCLSSHQKYYSSVGNDEYSFKISWQLSQSFGVQIQCSGHCSSGCCLCLPKQLEMTYKNVWLEKHYISAHHLPFGITIFYYYCYVLIRFRHKTFFVKVGERSLSWLK